MAQVLVVGGFGFIGQNLVETLTKNGHECIIGTSRISRDSDKCQLLIQPFEKKLQVKSKFEVIINTSGFYKKTPSFSDQERMIKSNLGVVYSVMNLAVERGIPLINLGSYFEKAPAHSSLKSLEYTNIKMQSFHYIEKLSHLLSHNSYYLYLYDTYGKLDTRNKLMNYIIYCKKNNKEIKINNPKNLINLTNIEDIVGGICSLVDLIFIDKDQKLKEFQIKSDDEFYISDLTKIVEYIALNKTLEFTDLKDFVVRLKKRLLWDSAEKIPNFNHNVPLVEFVASEFR
jgi:nucleoside-diphosphate-sugar epimerase